MAWKVQLTCPFLIETQRVKRQKQKKYLKETILKRIEKIVSSGKAEVVDSSNTNSI